ncbi:hypothetical protein CLV92_103161 [Kineococcus xinjiangensis]|uniref:Lipoprotein n=1 Tax=Kineococcus xinjiangensis TaxID=512762 RepID=A0A2S6ITP8_9ACTN|nr:hypothetical protein [Kineococcus xinjiangensis]PPK97627.1 hypothetical protein CLV92_103161 [Kineococcus xinjiangensis]
MARAARTTTALLLLATAGATLTGCGSEEEAAAPAPTQRPVVATDVSGVERVIRCEKEVLLSDDVETVFPAADRNSAFRKILAYTLYESTWNEHLLNADTPHVVEDFRRAGLYLDPETTADWDGQVSRALAGDPGAIAQVNDLAFFQLRDAEGDTTPATGEVVSERRCRQVAFDVSRTSGSPRLKLTFDVSADVAIAKEDGSIVQLPTSKNITYTLASDVDLGGDWYITSYYGDTRTGEAARAAIEDGPVQSM